MKGPGNGARRTGYKKAEIEQLLGMNIDQEAQITAIQGFHDNLLSLHEQAMANYKTNRLDHKEMHLELNQHQERSRDTSGSCSAQTEGVHQYLDPDKLRAIGSRNT